MLFFCTTTLASPHRRAFDAAKTLEEIAGTCWHYERETILNLCPPPPPPAAPGDPPNPPLEEGCDPPGEDDWATLTYPAFETLFMRLCALRVFLAAFLAGADLNGPSYVHSLLKPPQLLTWDSI